MVNGNADGIKGRNQNKRIGFGKSLKTYGVLVAVVLLIGVLLAGCAKPPAKEDVNKHNAGINNQRVAQEEMNKGEKAAKLRDTKQLDTLVNLLGKKDGDLTNAMGEGNLVKDEVSGRILSREYGISLFGEKLNAKAVLDKNSIIKAITIFLPANDITKWSAELAAIYGEVSQENQANHAKQTNQAKANGTVSSGSQNDGKDLSEMVWQKGDIRISLKSIYGGLTLEFAKR